MRTKPLNFGHGLKWEWPRTEKALFFHQSLHKHSSLEWLDFHVFVTGMTNIAFKFGVLKALLTYLLLASCMLGLNFGLTFLFLLKWKKLRNITYLPFFFSEKKWAYTFENILNICHTAPCSCPTSLVMQINLQTQKEAKLKTTKKEIKNARWTTSQSPRESERKTNSVTAGFSISLLKTSPLKQAFTRK